MADENDDLLNPEEIEALLNEAGAGDPSPTPAKESSENAGGTPPADSTADSGTGGDESEQLSQDELDRLMNEAKQGTAPLEEKPTEPAASTSDQSDDPGDLLDPGEIEKLLNARDTGDSAAAPAESRPTAAPASSGTATEQLLQQAEEGLAAAISSEGGGMGVPAGNAQPFSFEEFSKSGGGSESVAIKTLHDVELDIRIELGRTELLIDEVLQLRDGSVVPLDKLAGDPVDVIVNERLIARGEVLVLNDNFCVRITEILPPHF